MNKLRARVASSPVPREIWVIVAAAFIIAIGYGIVAPVLPEYAKSFNVSITAAASVVSAFALFRLLFAPTSGSLVGWIGERWTYLSGLSIVTLSTLATAFAPSFTWLLVFRALGGIGSTMFTVSAMALMVRLCPAPLRGRVSSLYATSFLIGGMMGPVLGGVLAAGGLRMPFIVYAIALFLAVGMVWWFLPSQDQGRANAAMVKPLLVREALKHKTYRAALVSNFTNGWTNFGVRVATIPLLVSMSMHAEPWVSGTALAIFAGGNALAVSRSGRFADLKGRKPMVITGLVVCGTTTSLMGFSPNIVILFVLSGIAGFGVGCFGPAQQATVADIIGTQRSGGSVLSTFQMSSDLGAIIGPILAGLIADSWGFGGSFALSGLLVVASSLLWLRAPETLPSKWPGDGVGDVR